MGDEKAIRAKALFQEIREEALRVCHANEAWVARQHKSPESRRLYEEERLLLEVTELISTEMLAQGVSQEDVATMLDADIPQVWDFLGGRSLRSPRQEIRVRDLATVAHALGYRVELTLVPLPAPPEQQDDSVTILEDGESLSVPQA